MYYVITFLGIFDFAYFQYWKYLSKIKLFFFIKSLSFTFDHDTYHVQQYQVILYGPVSSSTYIYFYHFYEHKYTTVRAPS